MKPNPQDALSPELRERAILTEGRPRRLIHHHGDGARVV